MIKIISSEEYAKLTGDIDYWKAKALEEERSKNFYKTLYKEEKSWHIFYKEEHGKRISEYMTLKEKYDELEKQKVTFISLGKVKNLNKAKKIAEEVIKELSNEHQCNKNCFAEHVLPAIQRDYDSRSINFKNDWYKRRNFLQYWKKKLKNEYNFIEGFYMIADTLRVTFK